MKRWSKETNLYLFTPDEFAQLPAGTELTSIGGNKEIKGKDNIDMDTRWGHIAWGIVDPWNHPLKDMFLIFKLVE